MIPNVGATETLTHCCWNCKIALTLWNTLETFGKTLEYFGKAF